MKNKILTLVAFMIFSGFGFASDCSINVDFEPELFSVAEGKKISRLLEEGLNRRGYFIQNNSEAAFHLSMNYGYMTGEEWCRIYFTRVEIQEQGRGVVVSEESEASLYSQFLNPKKMGYSATRKAIKKAFKNLPYCE